jgi:hypothetical protein
MDILNIYLLYPYKILIANSQAVDNFNNGNSEAIGLKVESIGRSDLPINFIITREYLTLGARRRLKMRFGFMHFQTRLYLGCDNAQPAICAQG